MHEKEYYFFRSYCQCLKRKTGTCISSKTPGEPDTRTESETPVMNPVWEKRGFA